MFGNRNDSSADSDFINNSFCNFKEERINNYWKTIHIAFTTLSYIHVCSQISDYRTV